MAAPIKKRILIVSPRFPIPATGACEQDRLEGIKQFIRLGYEVRVIAKVFDFQEDKMIENFANEVGIIIERVPYRAKPKGTMQWIGLLVQRIFSIAGWDGAAYEYTDPKIKQALSYSISTWKPDLVWFEYTYLWPLYSIVHRANIPIVTRSINFEPKHFLQEDGISIVNLLKFIPKMLSEIIVINSSDFLLSITPREEKTYKSLGAKNILTLPLRSLPNFIGKNIKIKNNKPLHVLFMGSTYFVSHNKETARFLIDDVFPLANKKFPDQFIFHIIGSKLPKDLEERCKGNVLYEGYIPTERLDDFFDSMDIALIPSLFGAGMQQKIFEPLVRGIPTITSERGTAGYMFEKDRDILFATSPEEYVSALGKLMDDSRRKSISTCAVALSREYFSERYLDIVVNSAINRSLSTKKTTHIS